MVGGGEGETGPRGRRLIVRATWLLVGTGSVSFAATDAEKLQVVSGSERFAPGLSRTVTVAASPGASEPRSPSIWLFDCWLWPWVLAMERISSVDAEGSDSLSFTPVAGSGP